MVGGREEEGSSLGLAYCLFRHFLLSGCLACDVYSQHQILYVTWPSGGVGKPQGGLIPVERL